MIFGKRFRRRPQLAITIGLVVVAGLASRSYPFLFPPRFGKYPGDALWALMIFLGIAFLRPGIHPGRLAFLALTVCWLVEFSQLYQAPWINSMRATGLGHLVLGSAFDGLDLCAYAIGIIVGCFWDILFSIKLPRPMNKL